MRIISHKQKEEINARMHHSQVKRFGSCALLCLDFQSYITLAWSRKASNYSSASTQGEKYFIFFSSFFLQGKIFKGRLLLWAICAPPLPAVKYSLWATFYFKLPHACATPASFKKQNKINEREKNKTSNEQATSRTFSLFPKKPRGQVRIPRRLRSSKWK